MFDLFYISFLNLIKSKFVKKSLTLSFYYICFVELSFYVLLVSFFSAFASQMTISTMGLSKAIPLFVLVALFVGLKNWMRYNGKRRNVLNAKSKKHKLELWKLLFLPIVCLVLAVVFFQAI
jgi:ABC-type Fe3+ transport system permease subunit